jgi:hypothetical protein
MEHRHSCTAMLLKPHSWECAMQAADDLDQCLFELAQETDRVATSIADSAICTRLHEIANELQELACFGADRPPATRRPSVRECVIGLFTRR